LSASLRVSHAPAACRLDRHRSPAPIEIERFDPMLAYGAEPKDAADYLTQMGPIGSVLQDHPEALRTQVAETLAGVLEAKRDPAGPAGIRLAAAAWIVSARNN